MPPSTRLRPSRPPGVWPPCSPSSMAWPRWHGTYRAIFIYVANSGDNTVVKISPDGKTVTPFASGFSVPQGLALDSQMNLYVTNTGDGTVSKVSPDGKKTLLVAGFGAPVGVVVDDQGNVIV